MFKCKECGTEYQIKPDYCDCGNDTFDEILSQESQKIDDEISPETDKNDMWVEENGFGYPIDEKSYNKMIKKETEVKTVKNNIQNLQPYAIITFAICLILSLLIILFAFNPKNTEEQKTKTKAEVTNLQNVPSIEKIWNNSTEGLSAYQNKGKTEQAEPAKQTTMHEETSKKKDETIKQTKQVKQEVKQVATTIQKPANNIQKNSIQKQKTQTSQNVSTPVTNTAVSNKPKANQQEIANYNMKLRNHIASKINFLSIVGDGSCTFSFKVAQDGTLTNKKATTLSDNESLNEAVYNALRQVYSYNAPPVGYKSQILNLTVKMYNNSYEVSLN